MSPKRDYDHKRDFSKTLPVKPGQRLEVDHSQGKLRITTHGLPEVRIQAFELERLVQPLGLAEPVEGGVAGLGLAGGVLSECEPGEDFEVLGRVFEGGEARDAEAVGRVREASGPVGRLALLKRRRPGVLLSPRGGHQDE